MAISNTSILVKRSNSTAAPTSLKAGELAYSYSSNNFFIGSPTGDGALIIAGNSTFGTVNSATNANTASTLVKRDANGAFYGRLFGVSNTAVALDTAQNFSITGDVLASSVSFNGTGAVALSSSLNTINPNTGTFGSITAIPIITVGANGRITSVTTVAPASSAINISDGTTSNTINAGATFYHLGTKGITTVVSANTVTFGTDNTVLRSNTTTVGTQTISTDLTVAGNLIVSGTATYVNTSTVLTTDSLIKLAANNTTGDVVDIGFYGVSNTNTGLSNSNTYHGLIREGSGGADAGRFFLFKNLPTDPTNNTIVYASATRATLVANLTGGVVNALANAINVFDGGTGQSSFTSGQILIGSGTNGLQQIANSTVASGQTFGTAAVVPVFTTDVYGRVASVTNTSIAIAASQVTSGQLVIAQGGTNASSYAQNGLLYYNGTSFLTSANQTAYTTQGGASYVPVISTNALGQVTVISNTQIQIDTSNIVSGTLPLTRGGTGFATATTNGITYGNGTGALGVTAAASTSDQTWSNQILTVTNAGVPVWSTALDGGVF